MIRPLSFVFLLGTSLIVLAEPLYKWVEPDGAITFSVTPPPAGVKYETVSGSVPGLPDTGADLNSGKGVSVNAESSRYDQSSGTITADQVTGTTDEQMRPQAANPVQPVQRLAPPAGSQTTLQQGIQRSSTSQLNTGTTGNPRIVVQDNGANNNQTGSGGQNRSAVVQKSRKQQQCEDLKKRVISLEGRLRNRLTPEDMDNTVLHMARYQRSYDQHCVQ